MAKRIERTASLSRRKEVEVSVRNCDTLSKVTHSFVAATLVRAKGLNEGMKQGVLRIKWRKISEALIDESKWRTWKCRSKGLRHSLPSSLPLSTLFSYSQSSHCQPSVSRACVSTNIYSNLIVLFTLVSIRENIRKLRGKRGKYDCCCGQINGR